MYQTLGVTAKLDSSNYQSPTLQERPSVPIIPDLNRNNYFKVLFASKLRKVLIETKVKTN